MRQYNQIKAKYPGAILLFRVGDFYETFGEDAVKAAGILGIVLTKRANGAASHIELAGFPHHSLDSYLPKLVRAGQRVAICDQLEDPKLTKKIVKRGVTELVTPGVSYNEKILDHKQNNYLCALHFEKDTLGVSFLDISTGEFMVAQGTAEQIDKLLQGLKPSEVILSKKYQKRFHELFGDRFYTYLLDEWVFSFDYAQDKLLSHFDTASLKGYGIDQLTQAIVAAGVSLHYLSETHHEHLEHINAIWRIEEERFVWLDRFTIRNLELLHANHEEGVSLYEVLDQTATPMGARMLKRWLVLPLKEVAPIQERLEVVEHLYKEKAFRQEVLDLLKQVGDLERLISKVALKRVNPREVKQLERALKVVAPLQELCAKSACKPLVQLADQLNPCLALVEKIAKELHEDPPAQVNKGGVIAEGVDEKLDELRQIAYAGKDYLLQIQNREIERTGIPSLKIGYNNVFGYYLEVTNAHKDKVPPEWVRKQTLVNAERYITDELKQYEEKILGAEEAIFALEERLFHELVAALSDYVVPIQQNAHLMARLDSLLSFALVAEKNGYVKPTVDDSLEIDLKGCRHPVIEQQLPLDTPYVPNDTLLTPEQQQIIILTGPNMSGKSAVLRQTALAVLMAQVGSFVPAKEARIGVVDKVFTRVGASDNISSGESTFMVEMMEAASILNNLSERSLILLDEIGRGTSTYDGVSLAWAIVEYLNQHRTRPKTLFATHYHELNELEARNPGVKNFHVSVKESGKKVIFLRKLAPGGSEHSFGIHVARMAGVPGPVVSRSEEILEHLEAQRAHISDGEAPTKAPKPAVKAPATTAAAIPDSRIQMTMFHLDDPLFQRISEEFRKLDVNTLTPVEALLKLNQLKSLIDKA